MMREYDIERDRTPQTFNVVLVKRSRMGRVRRVPTTYREMRRAGLQPWMALRAALGLVAYRG